MGLRTKQRGLNSESGFSLVELMVVVAIIGILSTVAVPRITKWLAKAKQTEAKSNLSALYSGMKAFFAEFQVYHGNFDAIGYEPEGNLRYRVGFGTAGTALSASAYPGILTANLAVTPHVTSAVCDASTVASDARTKPCVELLSAAAKDLDDAAKWTDSAFKAYASADLNGDTDEVDSWSISETKVIKHETQDD